MVFSEAFRGLSMSFFLGIDTSNYTTSAALLNTETGAVVNSKRLLPVALGQKGLRQSDALFLHTKALPDILLSALNRAPDVSAIGVSDRPRDLEGSYMPCFLAGVSAASSAALTKNIPLHRFSHQRGHIAAAVFSSKKYDLLKKPFLAFHVSGGTTDAILVKPDDELVIRCETVATTLDLNAGQIIDRVGVMLGLSFPAGAELEKIALKGASPKKIKPVLKGTDCCFSGVENQCKKMLQSGETKNNIARYAIDFILETISIMAYEVLDKFGDLPIVFAGGVMSDSIIREALEKRFDCFFAEPQYSCDNAVGIAVLTAIKEGYLL